MTTLNDMRQIYKLLFPTFYESNNEVDVSIIFLNCLIRKIFTMGPRWVEILRKSLTSGSIKELRPRFLSTYFI
jgi:hypothetical protein